MNEPSSLVGEAREQDKSLVHRFNNFLTLCMTHAEVALESRRTEDMSEALHWILEGARGMAPHGCVGVQHELPFAAQPFEESGDEKREAPRG